MLHTAHELNAVRLTKAAAAQGVQEVKSMHILFDLIKFNVKSFSPKYDIHGVKLESVSSALKGNISLCFSFLETPQRGRYQSI